MEQDKAMNECIYKTHEGYCILHSDGIDVREYCVEGPCDDEYSILQLIDEAPTLTPPNEALTIEQLREMNGEPAWWDNGEGSCWGIISVATNGRWAGIPFFRGRWKQANFEYDIKSRGMTLYRRPPEGEEGQNV